MRSFLILGLALLLGAITASANPPPTPTFTEFQEVCHENRMGWEDFRLKKAPKVGETAWIPLLSLIPGQTRMGFASIRRKLTKMVTENPDLFDPKKKKHPWTMNFDHGNSFYSEHEILRGFYYDGKVYLHEGHHRALISMYVGAITIPIEIEDDLTQKYTPKEFEQFLKKSGASYLYDENGKEDERVDFCDMLDDGNLELARMLFTELTPDEKGHMSLSKLKQNKIVIGLKTAIPFLEFYVADTLRAAGIVWNGTELTEKQYEACLTALQKAAKKAKSPLAKLLLFSRPLHVAELVQGQDQYALIQSQMCNAVLDEPAKKGKKK